MQHTTRAAAAAFALVAILVALGGTASAAPNPTGPVFVQTDNPVGNQVVAYDRAADGTLAQAGVYNTGGRGGVLEGSVVDHLASQDSLSYDSRHRLLFAVNAGSDTVSVFGVSGDRLSLRQVIDSGGSFPASIAVQGGLVFVLNAEGEASVQGYSVVGGRLVRLPGSNRSLGLSATQTPRFTNTPGQVAFSPDGRRLLVTTKGNGSAIDVFRIRPRGRLSAGPVVNSLPGEVPFALTFDDRDRLLVAEAGTNALASFRLNADDTVTKLDAVGTGQAATCWVVGAGGFFFTSNAGSGSLSRFQEALNGSLTLLGNTATHGGTVDAAISADGRFLYAQTGGEGLVDEFRIGPGGSLSPIGSLAVPGAVGGEGIVSL
jgi:6-phosphogluconolactonase (cycloisomerase 2 family)